MPASSPADPDGTAVSAAPCAANDYRADHVRLLRASYRRWTGRDLLPDAADDTAAARAAFAAPFALLSHATGGDPLFTYGNRAAMALFEMPWPVLLATPSRLSAEPVERAERERLLQRVRERGFIDDYAGVRISRSGRRFRIEGATVWTLVADDGTTRGQAAMFATWHLLDVREPIPRRL